MQFDLTAPYKPTGDQPKAIERLVAGLQKGYQGQTLLGVTGSGKTFTMANVVAQVQRPTLVISHNKTLAAQLAAEFREFFPRNAVHYFVSYYDYYQPEAYVPQSDTYIEKDADINEEIDRLRHAATQAVLSRRDVLIVASVSCIYGLGSPSEYQAQKITLRLGERVDRVSFLRQLTDMRFTRTNLDLTRGQFRVTGETMDIFPAFALDRAYRLGFNGDKLESLGELQVVTGQVLNSLDSVDIYPATHYLAPQAEFKQALEEIRRDLAERLEFFKKAGKLLEAERLEQRTSFDLEMLSTVGFVKGIENYSRYFDRRQVGQPPYTLMDFFPKDFLLLIDESHQTVPQITGMYAGDRSRKQTLVDYGFRLPAAMDNRPLSFSEFEQRVGQTVYVSATPAKFEIDHSQQVVEQLIRPTGLLDPAIAVRPIKGQIDDLQKEITARVAKGQRVLVTTLTKRLAEDLTEHLQDQGVKVQYLHSEVETLERIAILRDLRLGKYDVIVGINLLREGLDLPEVSLVAILDADKEGFLRSDVSLIQTMGRAARHVEGQVIMYADRMTGSMDRAIKETQRRRQTQEVYNRAHGITPQTIVKAVGDGTLSGKREEVGERFDPEQFRGAPPELLKQLLHDLHTQMELAAENLEFERAAMLRDRIKAVERVGGGRRVKLKIKN